MPIIGVWYEDSCRADINRRYVIGNLARDGMPGICDLRADITVLDGLLRRSRIAIRIHFGTKSASTIAVQKRVTRHPEIFSTIRPGYG